MYMKDGYRFHCRARIIGRDEVGEEAEAHEAQESMVGATCWTKISEDDTLVLLLHYRRLECGDNCLGIRASTMYDRK